MRITMYPHAQQTIKEGEMGSGLRQGGGGGERESRRWACWGDAAVNRGMGQRLSTFETGKESDSSSPK